MPSESRTLIWLKYRFLGDSVLTTPLLMSAAAAGIEADVWCAPTVAEILSENGLPHRLTPTVKRPFLQDVRSLRAQRYQRVFLVNRSIRTALIALAAGIPERIGHTTEGRGLLLTHRVAYSTARFELESYLDLLRAVGIEPTETQVQLRVTDAERVRGQELLQGATVGLQPGSTNYAKAIPKEAADTVISQATRAGVKVALLGGKEEREYADALAHRGQAIDLIGKCSIRETMGVLSQLQVFGAGDTGLVHIAAALGTRTVAAFGPMPAEQWGHRYEPHTVFANCGVDTGLLDSEAFTRAILG